MQKEFENDLKVSCPLLKGDGIILYPTDTVWGLGCDATSEVAVQKIIALKRRPENKSFVVLVADKQGLESCVGTVNQELMDYLDDTPRPTTVIYAGASGLAPSVVAKDGSVAIRICKDAFCQSIIRQLDRPLLSTSANFSGEIAPAIYSEIGHGIIEGVDYVVHYRQLDQHREPPSCIIKWEKTPAGDGKEKVIVLRS